jgi:MarR family transcriptional regulator, organic hydroperoxide resistance regulator
MVSEIIAGYSLAGKRPPARYAPPVPEFLDAFTRAAKLMRGAADQAMRRHGVRVGQNLVLAALWAQDGQTPGQLAQCLRIATPTVVKMATRMEAAGLLVREQHPDDRRLVRLVLTPRGRALQRDVERELERLERRATADLTDEERRCAQRALAAIACRLEADGT